MIIGAQLFTLRDFCKTTEDLAQTLAKVADIGYTTVQVSGTCDYDAAWLKKELDKNGLKCVITHSKPDRIAGDTEALAAEHNVLDCKYVGIGSWKYNKPEEDKTYESFIRNFKPAAQTLKGLGKYFMYHNHAHEFATIDGKLILDKIAEDFSPDELGFTLDTYWIQRGGGDPAARIEKFSGRVPCIHLKDMAYTTEPIMAPIGEGNINFDRVFAAAEKAGTQYMLVEQDNCNGEDPFDCLKRSYDFLTSRGFK
ncbi:MAG: sugar phosphate isomerase/epimerase [Clostridia bacterium]|nr:sugar phosphate isomerase/epimerase [Clostridia bacterium]